MAPLDARFKAAAVLACIVALTACVDDPVVVTDPPTPDRAMFDATIYPLLLRDCGFSECHGAEHRFFQVFGPGRAHIDDRGSDLAARERQVSYDRARSMLVPSGGGSIQQSPLLTKPLELSAGGATHRGADHYGRNVFRSVTDPRYIALWQWALTSAPPPPATPPPMQPMQPPAAGAEPLGTAGTGTVGALQPGGASVGGSP